MLRQRYWYLSSDATSGIPHLSSREFFRLRRFSAAILHSPSTELAASMYSRENPKFFSAKNGKVFKYGENNES